MFGDGLIHVRFVSSNHIERRQPSILDHAHVRPIFRCLLKELRELADSLDHAASESCGTT
jgi:hypothetical protein